MKKIIFFGMMICASISLCAQNAGEVERLRNKINEMNKSSLSNSKPAQSNTTSVPQKPQENTNKSAKSGAAGALSWNVSGSTLTISGTGKMPDYSYKDGERSPWYPYREIITRVEISAGVTSIGKWAFDACKGLTSVTIPNSVTSIGDWAFNFCVGLTSVTIPNSITDIDVSCFIGCKNLTSITVASGSVAFSSEGGVVFNKDKTKLVLYPPGKKGRYTIPGTVSSIGDHAFHDCEGLTSVTIPNSVTVIGDDAFDGCSGLTSVTISNSVKAIDNHAFSGCYGLTEVINMAAVPQSIKSNVFQYVKNIGARKLRVPAASLSLYQKADVWKDFKIDVIK